MMKHVYSVGQVNKYIKNMFAQDFMLHHISIKGEVSNCKYHSSGHIYFTMKDADGTINAIMFAGNRREGLKFQMKEGDRVVVTGSVEVYERDGRYQIYARTIERDGEGNLYLKFEALKRELEEMGMFAPEYKKAIPRYAKRIGVVTAPTGAAVRDIMNISARRNPYVQLLLYPAQVQGEGAKESIVRGIRMLETKNVDVIIVGRGGGSIEDLWAFNDECVARAIFDCQVPVISAVGHETDVTIADYVADLRAPTPSAAAELAVWDYRQLQGYLDECRLRMNRSMTGTIRINRLRLKELDVRLSYLHPRHKLQDQQQRLIELEEELRTLMRDRVKEARHRLAIQIEKLNGLSPVRKLNQGFAYVEEADGGVVKSIRQVEMGDELTVYVTDGLIRTSVKAVQKKTYKI
mgnify:CR=1 FL=1